MEVTRLEVSFLYVISTYQSLGRWRGFRDLRMAVIAGHLAPGTVTFLELPNIDYRRYHVSYLHSHTSSCRPPLEARTTSIARLSYAILDTNITIYLSN